MYRQALRGSISIFLILIMVPLLSGTYLAIDAGRTAAARSRMMSALNLTGNAALNDYDQALKDWYGLFAMGKSQEAMETELTAVFSGMIDAAEVTAGDPSLIEKYIGGFFQGLLGNDRSSYDNYVNTKTKTFSASFPSDAALARPDVLERTLTDYMKYRGPYRFARGVSQRLGAFHNIGEAADSLEKAGAYYDSLSGVSKQMEKMAAKLPVTTEFDEKAEETAIRTLLNGLDGLSGKVERSTKKAEAWKQSLDQMENGEAKALLSGDYKNTAEVLSQTGIENLRSRLNDDLEALENYKNEKKAAENAKSEAGEQNPDAAEPELPTMSYRSDALYGYIANSRAAGQSDTDGAGASSKQALEQLAASDRSTLTAEAPANYVSRAVGSAIASAIDAVGGEAAVTAQSSGGANTPGGVVANLKPLFQTLGGNTDSLMSDCYVEEFLTEQLSCYTTGTEEKNLAGKTLAEGPLFRGEVEYVLFGKDYLPTNVSLAADLIFMIRVLFNSMYAFSNAAMRAEALSVATAIAAWTGVGVVVVQNLILGAWAMAESVCDVSTLTKGGTVPIYKNAATWTLSLSGVSGKLAQGAASLASHTIDDVYARIEKAADDGIEQVRDAAMSYAAETSEGAVESLTNMILTPVESRLTAMIGNNADAMSRVSKADIQSMLMDAVNEADNGSAGFRAAKAAFRSSSLGPLSDVVYNNFDGLRSLDEEVSKTASRAIRNGISDAYATLFSEVKKAVDRKVSSAEQSLHGALQKSGNAMKENVIEAIDQYSETLSGYLGSDSGAGNGGVSSYAGTAMTYKDYLKVFVFAGIVNNGIKKGMLTRCAKVIQANCKKEESAFRITKAYREIMLSGEAGIVTHTVKGSESYAY